MSLHYLVLQPFDAPFTVALTPEARDHALSAAGFAPDPGSRNRGAVYTLDPLPSGGCGYLVYLPKRLDVATLHHEALHLVIEMMDRHSIPLAGLNQEWLCYMQEYAVRLIMDACYPAGGRGKRKPAVQ